VTKSRGRRVCAFALQADREEAEEGEKPTFRECRRKGQGEGRPLGDRLAHPQAALRSQSPTPGSVLVRRTLLTTGKRTTATGSAGRVVRRPGIAEHTRRAYVWEGISTPAWSGYHESADNCQGLDFSGPSLRAGEQRLARTASRGGKPVAAKLGDGRGGFPFAVDIAIQPTRPREDA